MDVGLPSRLRGAKGLRIAGGVSSVVIACVVYLQFSFYLYFDRDPSIYLYGGQRFTHGVPPFASIMDPKGPISGILCGFGVTVARLLDRNDVLVVRVEFCALSIATVLGVYVLVVELFKSVVAGVVAAAVFTSFRSFAHFADVGPDGHAPGTFFLVFALWLAMRRRWYWSAALSVLAFCTWQPLYWVPVLVLACALAWSPGQRRHSAILVLAGGLTPVVALVVYYAASGYPGKLFEGLFVFPLVGVQRGRSNLLGHIAFIARNTLEFYSGTIVLLCLGIVIIVVAAVWKIFANPSGWRSSFRDPIVLVLGVGTVVQLPYLVLDYTGQSHWWPLLPFAGAGFGLLTVRLLQRFADPTYRRRAAAAILATAAVLTTVCAIEYYTPAPDGAPLRSEQADACAIQVALAPGTPLWVIGNPIPLVLLHRVNPDNYPYVGSGLDQWKIDHTPGGFRGWVGQIKRSQASVVVVDTWHSDYLPVMEHWLHGHGFAPGFIGRWRVYVTPAARAQLSSHSLRLAHRRHSWPMTLSHDRYTVTHCTKVAAG